MWYICQEHNLSVELLHSFFFFFATFLLGGINYFFLKAILCETEAWRMVTFVSSTKEQEISLKFSHGSHIPHAFLFLPLYAVCSLQSHCRCRCVPWSTSLPGAGMAIFLRAEPCLQRVPWTTVILTLSSPPYRCLYPQPRVPGPRAKGLSAGWAQGGVPPPICPANWGWSKRDPVLSAAPWAETCHARAAGNGPGLGANPEEAWKGLGWHVRPVGHAQNCEDCVIVRTRQSSQLPARLTLGSWPTRDWRNIMHNTF